MSIFHQILSLLVALIWGTNFVFIRYGLDELQPFTFATLRFSLVAIPLVFFLPKPRTTWLHLISYGFFIGCGQFGLLFWVMQENITPGLASLIIQMQVFFTIILAVVIFGGAIGPNQIVALLVCFLGLALIISYTDGQTTLIGVAVTLVTAMSWACGNLIVKHAGAVNILAFLVWSSLFAVPPLALAAWYLEGVESIAHSLSQATWRGWSVVLWQSIGNTLVGWGLWNMLLNRYSAAIVTPWALLIPVFGMSASALFLSEPMPWWKLLAMVLICSGLALNMLSNRE